MPAPLRPAPEPPPAGLPGMPGLLTARGARAPGGIPGGRRSPRRGRAERRQGQQPPRAEESRQHGEDGEERRDPVPRSEPLPRPEPLQQRERPRPRPAIPSSRARGRGGTAADTRRGSLLRRRILLAYSTHGLQARKSQRPRQNSAKETDAVV